MRMKVKKGNVEGHIERPHYQTKYDINYWNAYKNLTPEQEAIVRLIKENAELKDKIKELEIRSFSL